MNFEAQGTIYTLDIEFIDTYLGRLWSWNTRLPNFTGIAQITEFTSEDLGLIINYWSTGIINGDVLRLVSLLQYMGEAVPLTVDYPPEFLKIKLEEDWYRSHQYTSKNLPHRLIRVDFIDELITLCSRDLQSSDNNWEIFERQYIETYSHRCVYRSQANITATCNRQKLDGCDKYVWSHVPVFEHLIQDMCYPESDSKLWNILNPRIKDSLGSPKSETWRCILFEEYIRLMFDGTCCIAGGSILDSLMNKDYVRDYDIFFYNCSPEDVEHKMFLHELFFGPRRACRTTNAISLGKVQFILRIYKDLQQVLFNFDLDASGIAFDGTDHWMTPRAQYALKYRMLCVDFDQLGPEYHYRLCKYSQNKSFRIYIPELNLQPTIPDLQDSPTPEHLASQEYLEQPDTLLSILRWWMTGILPTKPATCSYLWLKEQIPDPMTPITKTLEGLRVFQAADGDFSCKSFGSIYKQAQIVKGWGLNSVLSIPSKQLFKYALPQRVEFVMGPPPRRSQLQNLDEWYQGFRL